MDTMKATAADVGKNFGQFADKAMLEPVTITKYGRDHLVLLSADEYARLLRRDRKVYRAHELPDDIVDDIAKAEPPPEAAAFDHEYDAKASQRSGDRYLSKKPS